VFDNNNVFGPAAPVVPPTAKIVFVSDMFIEDYVGGAELTSQALIDSSPYEVFKLHSRDVTLQLLRSAADRFWIFGNFTEMNPQLIPSIVGNLKYSILEYDYKYCRARSPEKHFDVAKSPCDCHNQMNGKIVSAFFFGAMHIWWMSEKQRERYVTMFPFLVDRDNTVLSSVFDDPTLGLIKALRFKYATSERKGWIVLGSNSWIKGTDAAKQWCDDNKKEYEVVWNLPYEQLLEKLAAAEGFVYLPPGGDTCPRMVIEAKLLGCKLHLNDFVQHKDEEWFATDDIQAIEEYLYTARKTFWIGITAAMNYRASISGYTTTYNCIEQGYPFEQSIKSMLAFCDEVCVVDGGSTDYTWEKLRNLQEDLVAPAERLKLFDCDESRRAYFNNKSPIKLKQVVRDWNHPRFAVFDGLQKAEARAMCTKDFCWQMDSDEVVHEDDGKRIHDLCRALPKEADILALPVIEYWGGPDKIRLDIQPWKWRLSRNLPNITHGIPKELRLTDDAGNLYAAEGTDGCDMIDKETFERLPHVSFYTPDIENVRRVAMLGNPQAKQEYERWFNQVVHGLPSVFHYSWYNLPRKIRLYRDYWQNHWNALWNKDTSDTAANNMMFDVPWSEVTDEMIEARATEMKHKLGGWIWHHKWDGETHTDHIVIDRSEPSVMQETK
jgi:glycosyltransferase involved in cell wall biosynthesis